MAVVAGVDSSTQSTKVEVREAETGRLLGRGHAAHPATTPPASEQDPEAWAEALDDALGTALAEARRTRGVDRLDAIAVAAQQHGLVALDAGGQVIRRAVLWNDTRAAPDAAWLVGQLGGPAGWAEGCGSVPVASFTIAKLSWLHRTEPDRFDRIARVCLPHDWLTSRLTGRFTTDRGDASGTGYWSPAAGRYRWDLLGIVQGGRDWSTAVPEVLGPMEVAGSWRGAVVAPGTGDNMAAALGLGLRPGDVAVSIGTSGTVFAISEEPTHDTTGAVAGFADASGRFLPLVCTLNAAKVTDAVARLLDVDAAAFDALALDAEPGAAGLVLLPYLDGERTPNRPDAAGVLAGLRGDVERAQLARAAVEGVVCGLLDGLDALAAHAPVDGRLLLTGGGARSAAYRRVLADLAGRPVTVVELDESVAAGACAQAAAVLHGTDPLEVRATWEVPCQVIDPRPIDAAAIRGAYAARRAREG